MNPPAKGEGREVAGDSVYRKSVGRDDPGAPFSGDMGIPSSETAQG